MGVESCLVCITEGLLCGKGVEPPRGRGRLSGVWESQLFFGYIKTKMFSKIHLVSSTTSLTINVFSLLDVNYYLIILTIGTYIRNGTI